MFKVMCKKFNILSFNLNLFSKIVLTTVFLIFALLLPSHFPIKLLLFLLAYLIISYEILANAVLNIFKGEIFDENFLMSVATIGALCLKDYPEAIMVMLLYSIGEFLQDKAVENSKKSITEIIDLRPDTANVLKNDKIINTPSQELKLNDIIVVKTGEKIAVDGIIQSGHAIVDTSALTGESIPRQVNVNDEILSGCILINGYIEYKVTKTYSESTVSQILKLISSAENKKSKTENFITKFAKIYTPIVVFLAIFLATIPPLILHTPFLTWVNRALTFLVISCPCALVISLPLGFFAGLGASSKKGVLIKGSKYLEILAKSKNIVFDKTGTLTKGNFVVEKVVSLSLYSETEILKLMASIEQFSNHPIAKSIQDAYKGEIYSDFSNISEIMGRGIEVEFNGDKFFVGSQLKENLENISINQKQISTQSGNIVYISKNSSLIGYVILTDELKPNTKNAITLLQKMKKTLFILSGDTKQVVQSIAKTLKITKAYSELLPQNKVEKLEEIINSTPTNKTTLFVGDGINDAPALKLADVGIAMGGLGSDSAINSADVVIMDDDLLKIPQAIRISQRTLQIIKQNICFILVIKTLFLILGAFGYMTMWGAVFADVGVTILAVFNSLKILKSKNFLKI